MFKLRIFGVPDNEMQVIENPSISDLQAALASMDKKRRNCLQIFWEESLLTIVRGYIDRFDITFVREATPNSSLQWGILFDPNYGPKQGRVRFTDELGAVESRPIRKTVDRQTTQMVAEYFLLNHTLPKGLKWGDGDMSEFA